MYFFPNNELEGSCSPSSVSSLQRGVLPDNETHFYIVKICYFVLINIDYQYIVAGWD